MKKLLLTIILFFTAGNTLGGDKQYPPYPDVWGYEFPILSPDNRHAVWKYWRTPSGDIRILYSLAVSQRPIDNNIPQGRARKILGILDFFSGARRYLSGTEADEERERPSADREINTVTEKITFSDGSSVQVAVFDQEAFDGKCFASHPYFLQHQDKSGQVLARKSIVYVHKRPLEFVSKEICGVGTNVSLERSVTDGIDLIPLDDETFLVRTRDGHYVLRFDKDLRTDYSSRGRLYIVDSEAIESIRTKHRDLPWPINEETINNEVTEYVLQLPKRRKK